MTGEEVEEEKRAHKEEPGQLGCFHAFRDSKYDLLDSGERERIHVRLTWAFHPSFTPWPIQLLDTWHRVILLGGNYSVCQLETN